MTPALVPLAVLAPLLVLTIWCDLKFLRIPNLLVGGAIVTAVVVMPIFLEWPDILYRLGIAGGVFVAGFAAFSFRLIGGGDVKMLTTLMLFIPPHAAATFCLLLSAALLVGIAGVQGLRAVVGQPGAAWGVLRENRRYPMGLSIGLAGLALPWLMP